MAKMQSYHADTGALVIQDDGGSSTYVDTANVVAVLKDVDVNGEFELSSLYGMDSIKRQKIARTKLTVSVRARFARWNGELLGQIAGTETADKDAQGNTSVGRTRISVADTNTPNLFNMLVTLTEGTDTFACWITNIAFKNLPMKLPEGEWVEMDLEGEAADIFYDRAS